MKTSATSTAVSPAPNTIVRLALDKTNKSAQAKLVLVRQLYAMAPSSNAPEARGAGAEAGDAAQYNKIARRKISLAPFAQPQPHLNHAQESSMLRRTPLLLAAGLAFGAMQAQAANPQVDLDTSAGKIRIELYRTPRRRRSRTF